MSKITQYKEKNGWDGRKYTFPFSLVGADIIMQFKTSPGGRAVFEYRTDDGTLIIDGSSFSMTPRVLNYPPQIYLTDVRITFPGVTPKNYAFQKIQIIPIVSY